MFLTTERKVKASFTGDERRWQTNEDQTKNLLESVSGSTSDHDGVSVDHDAPFVPGSADPDAPGSYDRGALPGVRHGGIRGRLPFSFKKPRGRQQR